VFLVLLPPLLFTSAFNTSWHDFRFHLVSILLLAFGLVGFTVLGVALASNYLLPGFDWRLGLALGAVICSTDAIAATAIAARVGLPRPIVDMLEGESLVNDASSLLALEFAVSLVVSGQTPGVGEGELRMLILVGGGLAVGLLSAWCLHWLQRRVVDPPVEITLSLMAPYVAYLLAEAVHASGPLATVVCGLYLGHKASDALSTQARLGNSAIWNTIDFLLNGLVFIVLGLQLPFILQGIRSVGHARLLLDAAMLSGVVIALRMLWMYPGALLAYIIRTRVLKQRYRFPGPRTILAMGWTGMRGVLALAAAISLPRVLENGAPFPQREMIIFLTFSVILVTLVLQGLTLPAMIRKLGLCETDSLQKVEQDARRRTLQAAIDYLASVQPPQAGAEHHAWSDVMHYYQERYAHVTRKPEQDGSHATSEWVNVRELAGQVRARERAALQAMRAEDRISDHVLRKLERELDLLDERFV
jgi:CPA1 family monovalent cation:H+ antiporter